MAVTFSNEKPPKLESAKNIRDEYDQHGNEIITHVGDDGEPIKTEVKLSDNGAVDTTVGTATVSDDEKMQMELVSMPTLVLAKINFHSDIVEEDPFYKIWTQVDMTNYTQLRNFKTSGLGGHQWPKLEPIPSDNVEDYIKQYLSRAY